MGVIRFGIPEHTCLWLRELNHATTFVETGTYLGATTGWAARHFRDVITIEGQKELQAKAKANNVGLSNIRYLQGDSRELLPPVVKELTSPAVFWLDAHWFDENTFGKSAECPVVDEVLCVNQSDLDHIIMIDDACAFTAPPPSKHRAEDWPDLLELAAAFSSGKKKRYVVIHEDVFISVPERFRSQVTEYLRAHPTVPRRCYGDRIVGFVKRLLGR